MALDILVWIFAAAFSVVAIILVYFIIAWIVPLRNSPGKYFLKAKREKKPIIISDVGKHFRFIVGDEKVGEEKNQVIRHGTDMIKVPNIGGLKYAEGNVLMGVAEDFRAMVTNVAIIDLMEALNRKGWDQAQVDKLLRDLTTNLKIDLGFVNGGEKIREKFDEDIKTINAHYDAAIERLTPKEETVVIPGEPGDLQGNGDNEEGEDDVQETD